MKTTQKPIVTQTHITNAFREAGVLPAEIVLIHSSLKSFGVVEGGALAVISGAKAAVGALGTVVFPTLTQQNFENAYRNWNVDTTPSDVGVITEAFRRLPGTLRSDQATHSVAAWGEKAAFLTEGHTAFGPRMGIFGDYAFSYSSPWQKMAQLGARIVFVGVDLTCNTFKHFAEYRLVEYFLSQISDEAEKCAAMAARHQHNRPGVWPLHDGKKQQQALHDHGLLSYASCGNATFIALRADEFVDFATKQFLENPEAWFNPPMLDWMRRFVPQFLAE